MRESPAVAPTIRTAITSDLRALQRVYRAASLSNPGDAPHLVAHPEYLVFTGDGIADGRTRLAESASRRRERSWGSRPWFLDLTAGSNLTTSSSIRSFSAGGRRALIADAVESARAAGYRRLSVVANPHAAAFYSAVGFVAGDLVTTTLGAGTCMDRTLGEDEA
jgi:hypothetical protein